ncbi:MAG: insulinase family protein [Myxococcota bacterium]
MSTLSMLLLVACSTKSPAPSYIDAELADKPLPVDPGVRQGQLDNGLRWYIETNGRPADRAELRLVVNAGSVLEDDDQLGLAHFVEHMAFNGTQNFPANTLVEYLESTGTRFGAHLNAYTSFDRTVYQLRVPTDDAELFDKGFLVLADWAAGISFDDEEIEKERGVALEELRRRLGPGQRISEALRPLTLGGSRYENRIPIGTEESLKTFAPDAARRFYADWYRPDLMAVIAVGDFDPDAVQAIIEKTFEPLENPASPRPRDYDRIPGHKETRYALLEDPELPGNGLQIRVQKDMPQDTTYGEYRSGFVGRIAHSVFNERLADIVRASDAPFINGMSGESRFNKAEGAQFLRALAKEGQALETYQLLMTELKRLRVHGIRESELTRSKKRILEGYDSMEKEKSKTESRSHAQELVRVFAEGESMPGVDAEVAMARMFVPEFTKSEIDAYLASEAFFGPADRLVNINQPAKEGLSLPTVEELQAVDAEIAAATIDALPEESDVGPLLTQAPTKGAIVETSTEHEATLGFKVYTLSNGVTVWARKTTFKDDEVRFSGFSLGGHSWLDDDAYVNAAFANSVAYRSGLGAHDASTLTKWKAGRPFRANIGLGEFSESVSGGSTTEDLEAALQELYARFVAPQLTVQGLEQAITTQREVLLNRDVDPDAAFGDAYAKLVWPDDARRQPWTIEHLDLLDLAKVKAQYEAHYGHATDFTFVFVGNLPDNFETLVETYLASLPTKDTDPEWKDRGTRPKTGDLSVTVRKGQNDKARVRLTYFTPLKSIDWTLRNHYYSMTDILAVHLRRELREERGGVYGVSVRAGAIERPTPRAATTIRFTCDPARVDELITATEAAIASLKRAGPDPQDVLDEQAKNRRSRETALETNGFWMSSILGSLRRGDNPEAILDWDSRNDALSVATVKAVAKQMFGKNQAKVVLLPEDAETASAPR